ncbi:hypothetical protein [uncultured Paraglaciecola sp.]|nr:hypothetical protein [uncultured Paraglaciecola sp.]
MLDASREQYKDYLVQHAGLDPMKDREFVGYVNGFSEVINLRYEEESTEE